MLQNCPQQLRQEKKWKASIWERKEKRCLYLKVTSFHLEKILRNSSLKAVKDNKVDSARLQNIQSQLYLTMNHLKKKFKNKFELR